MATPKSIPSQLSAAGAHAAPSANKFEKRQLLYITAILEQRSLTVDGIAIGSPGPLSLSSPIACTSFITDSAGQLAYYIK